MKMVLQSLAVLALVGALTITFVSLLDRAAEVTLRQPDPAQLKRQAAIVGRWEDPLDAVQFEQYIGTGVRK